MKKIEIKNRFTGDVIFSYSAENNTMKKTLIEALHEDVDVSCSDLSDVDLWGVDMSELDLFQVDFSGSNLSYASFACSELSDVDLWGTNLHETNMWGTIMDGCDIEDDPKNKGAINI